MENKKITLEQQNNIAATEDFFLESLSVELDYKNSRKYAVGECWKFATFGSAGTFSTPFGSLSTNGCGFRSCPK